MALQPLLAEDVDQRQPIPDNDRTRSSSQESVSGRTLSKDKPLFDRHARQARRDRAGNRGASRDQFLAQQKRVQIEFDRMECQKVLRSMNGEGWKAERRWKVITM